MKQLKPQDAQFLFMEDGQVASHVTSIMICDQSTAPEGSVRFKDILKLVEQRLSSAPLYSQKLMRLPFDIDFPYWVEDQHFELEYHVRHSRLPEPSDWRQFCIQVARIHSRPLNLSRPPWELDVIAGLDNVEGVAPGSFALVMKMHHAAVDGTSAQSFIFSMMDLGPEGPPIAPPPSGRRGVGAPNLTPAQALTRAAVNNATAPARMANAMLRMAPKLAGAAARGAISKDDTGTEVPMTRFNGDISPNRAFDAVSFELATFKKIAKAFGESKVNDVVLAVCGGALREYLKSKNELPPETLVITAPVNKRKLGADVADDGNDISAMSVPLYTNVANASDRLKSITRATQSAKSAKSGLKARITTDLSKHLPAMTLSTMAPFLSSGRFTERLCNGFVSNVAGVQFPVYFCGAKVSNVFGMAPIGAGMGLFIATPSYDGKMNFSITTTRQIMPDTPYFINCLKMALSELERAAEKKMAAGEVSAARKVTGKRRIHRTRPLSEIGKQAHEKKEPAKKKKKKNKKDKAGKGKDKPSAKSNGVAKAGDAAVTGK